VHTDVLVPPGASDTHVFDRALVPGSLAAAQLRPLRSAL